MPWAFVCVRPAGVLLLGVRAARARTGRSGHVCVCSVALVQVMGCELVAAQVLHVWKHYIQYEYH